MEAESNQIFVNSSNTSREESKFNLDRPLRTFSGMQTLYLLSVGAESTPLTWSGVRRRSGALECLQTICAVYQRFSNPRLGVTWNAPEWLNRTRNKTHRYEKEKLV